MEEERFNLDINYIFDDNQEFRDLEMRTNQIITDYLYNQLKNSEEKNDSILLNSQDIEGESNNVDQ